MLDVAKKQKILESAKHWFRDTVAKNHILNTEKLCDPSKFTINPFLTVYLANFLTGNSEPKSIAQALLLPRVLGTSITTSFGSNIQSFTNILLEVFGSTTSGVDIEFIDQLDGHKKYCQLKAGPNTINSDDVKTIADHFKNVINLGKVNNLRIHRDDMIVGVVYGTYDDLSAHYKKITTEYDYPVIVGKDFWHRLTGDENFYADLIQAIGYVAIEADYSKEFNDVVRELSESDTVKYLARTK